MIFTRKNGGYEIEWSVLGTCLVKTYFQVLRCEATNRCCYFHLITKKNLEENEEPHQTYRQTTNVKENDAIR